MKVFGRLKALTTIVLIVFSLSAFPQGNSRQYVDFTAAAEQSVHAVVHIKTQFLYQTSIWEDFFGDSFWSDFFGETFPGTTQQEVLGAGSGVIISPDGYIVTNNHVVEDAKEVTVTLNDRREFKATVVGTDPQTDLALIKIECSGLPVLEFGNSDDVRIGEWVLAVGNPFNLTSTVTAGIVSAKARNLNILGENTSIESFIQTDAAVNQGNSGGALVSADGMLIGINSAIASGNGYYTGYSFAIPSNIARKVVDDLKKYGTVQRAYIGVAVVEINNALAEELGLSEVKGLLVKQVTAESAAEQAGLRADDIILDLDGKEVNSASELKEIVAQHSPGDTIAIGCLQNGQKQKISVTLLNNMGNTNVIYGND